MNDFLIDLTELNYKKSIDIDLKVNKDEELDKRIIDLDAYVKGRIYVNSNNDIYLELDFSGTMYLLDAVSLEKVPYKFTIKLNDSLEEITENSLDYDKNMQKTLDLKQILWQNIVLEVPISYTVCKDANLKGVGWEFKSANVKSKEEKEEIDPRLKKLEDLLKGDD